MTSRLHNPNTETDLALHARLSSGEARHFIMVAGAGSGKTTSLVKALMHLEPSQGKQFRRHGQKIACITYTEVAVEEIKSDVGHDDLYHVSTIHSFLWSVIRPFQVDLREWVHERLDQKIAEEQEKIANPGTHQTTKERAAVNIERNCQLQEDIKSIRSFRYGTGSDYSNGILGHSDILRIGPEFIQNRQLMRNIVVKRFPVIFVDESQDTDPGFVEALRAISRERADDFCLGFFGDPMQKIYMQGTGAISVENGWETLRKPENFRCPQKVLQVINRIRAEDDGLVQTGGCVEERDGDLVPVQGTARIIVLPADERRQEHLQEARRWLAEHDGDPKWLEGNGEDLRLLVLVHRMAANRLGFPNLYSALNDKSPEELKSGLIDGTAWVLRPFLVMLLPLILAHRAGHEFEVIRLLRKQCPKLDPRELTGRETVAALASLRDDMAALDAVLEDANNRSIGDVVKLARDQQLLSLDARFVELLDIYTEGEPLGDPAHDNALHRFMRCDARELWGYRMYIEELSPFATQQSIKGAEFTKVLVVVDDEEGRTNTFSYGKYFGVTALSARDQENIATGIDSIVDRTRRLFYVCCSRARRDLCVIVFANDPVVMHEGIIEKEFFEPDDVHIL